MELMIFTSIPASGNSILLYALTSIAVCSLIGLIFWGLIKDTFSASSPKKKIDTGAYISALGGDENIIDKKLSGSRITIKLANYDLLDKEKLLEAGVDSYILMSDRLVLVVKDAAEKTYNKLFGE